MPVIPLNDASDARLGPYVGVRDPELLRDGGRFVAEGRLVVRRLLESSRVPVESVLVSPAAFAQLEDALAPRLADTPVFVVPTETLVRLTGFNLHRGCLAIGRRPAPTPWRELVGAPTSCDVVVLERLANADNVGAAFRNAHAFGAGAVLPDPGTCDPWYRKAIRTSAGATLVVPFARAEPWPAMLGALRNLGFTLIALTPRGGAVALDEAADLFARAARIAWLVGNEGDGLSDGAMSAADISARIPIAPGVDSLNAGTALAIALFARAAARRAGARGVECGLR